MTQTQEKTCAELIDSELADREQYLADLYAKQDGDTEEADQAMEEIHEMAYGISTFSVARVVWSGGGPSDFIEITYDDSDIIKVEYVYQDWYDGARVTVQEDSAVYRYAEEIMEGLQS